MCAYSHVRWLTTRYEGSQHSKVNNCIGYFGRVKKYQKKRCLVKYQDLAIPSHKPKEWCLPLVIFQYLSFNFMTHLNCCRWLCSLCSAEIHYSCIHISKLTMPGNIPRHWGQLALRLVSVLANCPGCQTNCTLGIISGHCNHQAMPRSYSERTSEPRAKVLIKTSQNLARE